MNFFSKYILLTAILIGLSLSGYMGISFYEEETKAIEQDFHKDVDDKAAALERELLLNIEVLFAIKGLFDSSDDVSSAEFNRIAQSFLARHQDIQALEWAPKVLGNQRLAYVDSRRAEFPDFEITEVGPQGMIRALDRNSYFPVSYVAPIAGNEVVLGFDLSSSDKRVETLEKARDLDQSVASPGISLLQYHSNQKGIRIFVPIYTGEPTTVFKRRDQLRGYVLGVYRIGDMFDSAIKRTSAHGIYFSLEDRTSNSDSSLYSNFPAALSLNSSQQTFAYEKSLTRFSGRQWTIVAVPSTGYVVERRGKLPYMIAIFGGLFVLLGASYIYAILRRSELIESEVEQRTHDLNEAKRKLEELSQTDGLTKIPNRRCFDETLQALWQKAIREESKIGLMMIDIDHFKLYNDTYGHLAGDQCLREVAQALSQTLNLNTDLVARYGGEEFVVLLPDTRDCLSPAKRCQYNIERLGLPHNTSLTSEFITVSIGVASISPAQDSDLIDLTTQADLALYEAKNSGRNRVCFFKPKPVDISTISHKENYQASHKSSAVSHK
ncbi:diguanylate cyclase [Shewanella canadensis]|uniref:diguanylate cyclase n=1 Tax=Shewanella canadensis TaxID=271096 RepID=A0A431WXC0_9GAMM|nr:diguanylate cyclase [Shewanella canadensis]RTR40089.1 diguanylate cyclase [Shewanella canadensis]